jgi:CDP-glucose 4,6-dehydratase
MLEIYNNKRVFITGNSGFKGSWLALLLIKLGAKVEGYSLPPITDLNHHSLNNLDYKTSFSNILDIDKLTLAIENFQPEIIFHLAAQALVKQSYVDPINTYQTNVIGTLNLLEAAKKCKSVKAAVIITTDKVYENKEKKTPYTEDDILGGYDMYSSSKACCEILIKSYRNSFLNIEDYKTKHNILIATARAGNVIGGGDWSDNRLIPDIVKATAENKKTFIRNPLSVRPWQHVLDCIYGYLLLGKKLLEENMTFAESWNFSPFSAEAKNVKEIISLAQKSWSTIDVEFGTIGNNFHEAGLLILNNTKAIEKLKWLPVWNTEQAVEKTIKWYKAYYHEKELLTEDNIDEYLKVVSNN